MSLATGTLGPTPRYPVEELDEDTDNGTMQDSLDELGEAVIGHRIVSAEEKSDRYGGKGLVLTLDNGRQVEMVPISDCCAFTELSAFLLQPDAVDHIITGVGSTDEHTTWHIYADMGDVLQLEIGWSAGNPFYYGYGFSIEVRDKNTEAKAV